MSNVWWFPASCAGMTEDRCGFCCERLVAGKNWGNQRRRGIRACSSCRSQWTNSLVVRREGGPAARNRYILVKRIAHKTRKRGLIPPSDKEIEQFIEGCLKMGCECCGIGLSVDVPSTALNRLQIDQLVPQGGYVLGNMCGLCSACNRLKQDHTLETAQRLVRFLESKINKQRGHSQHYGFLSLVTGGIPNHA